MLSVKFSESSLSLPSLSETVLFMSARTPMLSCEVLALLGMMLCKFRIVSPAMILDIATGEKRSLVSMPELVDRYKPSVDEPAVDPPEFHIS